MEFWWHHHKIPLIDYYESVSGIYFVNVFTIYIFLHPLA